MLLPPGRTIRDRTVCTGRNGRSRLHRAGRPSRGPCPHPGRGGGGRRSSGGGGARGRLRAACLGQALYRHGTVFRSTSDAPVWSHVELSYFRDFVPGDVIRERVAQSQPPRRAPAARGTAADDPRFLRAAPRVGGTAQQGGLPGLTGIHRRAAGLPRRLPGDHAVQDRAVCRMARCGGRIGTFRAMETAAVLHHDPAFAIAWNQIHLAEMPAENFSGFGPAFATVPPEIAPAEGLAAVFAVSTGSALSPAGR